MKITDGSRSTDNPFANTTLSITYKVNYQLPLI